uniref:Serine-threonine kinase receptor-associated protein n=1 Tax=Ailuropoda melanoleuca TaxID=9646 RepID=A0A7N5KIZ9_AILME
MATPLPSTSGNEGGGDPQSGSGAEASSGLTHVASFLAVNAGMKPILLQGHERSITQIKYNREGDLLFTVAKDPIVNVWYSVNGERLGTYMGHTGAVWCVDADWDTKHVLTGSADNSCRLWDCETGKQLALLKTNSAVRTCGFDFGGNIIMFSTDKQMGYQCFVSFFDLRDPSQIDSNEPYMKIPCNDSKITSAVWGPLGECIIAGHEGGELNQYSAKSGEVLVNVKEHSRQINDIQLSRDMTMFVTASKDNTAKLFDSTTLEHQKTFRTERPVNSAALSPNYDHGVLGQCYQRQTGRSSQTPLVSLPRKPVPSQLPPHHLVHCSRLPGLTAGYRGEPVKNKEQKFWSARWRKHLPSDSIPYHCC